MNFKKLTISIILILSILVISLTACGDKMTDSADVHVFYYTYSDPYISTVRASLDKTLNSAGIRYQDHDSNNNQTTQTEQIQTAITKGAKLLVVNIVTTGSNDAAKGITATALKSHWKEICAEIEKLPETELLRSIYLKFGVKSHLSDIGLDGAVSKELLDYSPMVRNRLTLMRLKKAIKSLY